MIEFPPSAAGGFSSAAGHYAKARPAYPRSAIGLLKEELPPGPVLDVAAGTGILTGQLSRAKLNMFAGEPVGEMAQQLRRALPRIPMVECTAESLPFADGSFDAVTVAQAFHWFDAAIASAEIHRVLNPPGRLALIWNARDESVDWVRRVTDLVESHSGGRPYSPAQGQECERLLTESGLFRTVSETRFANPQRSSPELLAARVRSTSFVAALSETDQDALLNEVNEVIRDSPELTGRQQFEFPHTCSVVFFDKTQ